MTRAKATTRVKNVRASSSEGAFLPNWTNLVHRAKNWIFLLRIGRIPDIGTSIEERYEHLFSIQDPEESLNTWRGIRNDELTIHSVWSLVGLFRLFFRVV